MVILITGASHTGKTLLAQRMLEKYKYPAFSIDHLKMGLIRITGKWMYAEYDTFRRVYKRRLKKEKRSPK